MPGFDGNGNFSFTYNWVNDAANGIPITASRMDTQFNDAALGFDDCITRDGQSTTTALIPFSMGLTTDTVSPYTSLGPVAFSAGQIGFPSTQNPSASANVLDDYEEGTWTPVLNFGGVTTGITYATQSASYTKIGNRVCFELSMILTSKGAATGAATITGLPFTAGTACTPSTFGDALSLTGQLQARILASGVTIFLYALGVGAAGALQNTNCTNTSEIDISGTFRV